MCALLVALVVLVLCRIVVDEAAPAAKAVLIA